MIKVSVNPSFPTYYDIYSDGQLVYQVLGMEDAKQSAIALAKTENRRVILFLDVIMDVYWKKRLGFYSSDHIIYKQSDNNT